MLRWFGSLELFVLFQLIWSPVGSITQAHAQTGCTDTNNTNLGTLAVHGNLATGTCTFGGVPASGFTIGNVANSGATLFNVSFFGRDGGQENPTALTCTGTGTIVGGNTVNLNNGEGCAISATFDISGTILTLTGNIARTGTTVTTTGFVVTGGLFTLPAATATGPTAQDKSNITAALQNSLITVTPGLLSGGLPLKGNSGGNGNGIAFSPTGLGFARSSINSANPMDRDYGAAFAPQGYFAYRGARQRNNGFNFSVDLNQMAKAANDNEAAALGYGENG